MSLLQGGKDANYEVDCSAVGHLPAHEGVFGPQTCAL